RLAAGAAAQPVEGFVLANGQLRAEPGLGGGLADGKGEVAVTPWGAGAFTLVEPIREHLARHAGRLRGDVREAAGADVGDEGLLEGWRENQARAGHGRSPPMTSSGESNPSPKNPSPRPPPRSGEGEPET